VAVAAVNELSDEEASIYHALIGLTTQKRLNIEGTAVTNAQIKQAES